MEIDTSDGLPASQGIPSPGIAGSKDHTAYASSSSAAGFSSLSSPPRPVNHMHMHKSPGARRYGTGGSLDSSGVFGNTGSSLPVSGSRGGGGSSVNSQLVYGGGSVFSVGQEQFHSHHSSENDNIVYSDRFIPSRSASDLENAFDGVMPYETASGASAGTGTDVAGHRQNSGGSAGAGMDVSSTRYSVGPAAGGGSSRYSSGAMNSLLRSELLGHNPGAGGVSSSGYPSAALEDGFVGAGGASLAGDVGADRLRSSTDSIWSNGSGGAAGGGGAGGVGGGLDMRSSGTFTGHNVLKFRSDRRRRSSGDSASIGSNTSISVGSGDSGSMGSGSHLATGGGGFGALPGSPSVLGHLGSPGSHKSQRKISKTPFKVLDAPALQDDYYLNLVDWSSTNVLSVALGSSVYLWSACTSKVTKLCDTGSENAVTSICWSPEGTHLAVGTNYGKVQIWDVHGSAHVRDLTSHASRVGTMAWSSTLLATGSRDRIIKLQDARIRSGGGAYTVGAANTSEPCVVHELASHKQEVCGLKWSHDEKMLASGGNDNKLYVWALNHANPTNPVCRFSDHNAAVKAVAWSPHQSGLLASGGGTADRNIRFWNALTGLPLHRIDTGSQVCNLMWSKNVNEIVSTHGYSLNQIIVWKYPTMHKVATLTGHSLRVLYLAVSPDGQSVVTGAGDETLRFWNLFPGQRSSSGARGSGILFPGSDIR